MTEIKDITKAITEELTRYSKLVKEDFEKAKKETADDIKKELKRTSPERRPRYKKGWAIKKQKGSYLVHNRTDYQLTHLLEKGHVRKGGGDRVQAIPHIGPAEKKNVKEFLEKVEKAIKK